MYVLVCRCIAGDECADMETSNAAEPEMRRRADSLERENAELRARVATLERTGTSDTTRIARLEDENGQLRRDNDILRAHVLRLEAENAELRLAIERLTGEVRVSRERISTLEECVRATRATVAALEERERAAQNCLVAGEMAAALARRARHLAYAKLGAEERGRHALSDDALDAMPSRAFEKRGAAWNSALTLAFSDLGFERESPDWWRLFSDQRGERNALARPVLSTALVRQAVAAAEHAQKRALARAARALGFEL